jgi:hypothetical protein
MSRVTGRWVQTAPLPPCIHHHGRDREAFHKAARGVLAAADDRALGVARLCTYAYRCPDCGHVDHSGPEGGMLTPCGCGGQQDRFVTVLFAGEAYDMGLASEIGQERRG